MSGVTVEAAGLAKSYQRSAEVVHAVRQASFTLRPGTITVLAGPSGSGKTTLLNLLLRWEQPDAGSVVGLPARPTWADLAVVPQALGLLATLTVGENVSLPVRVVGRGRDPGDRTALQVDRTALQVDPTAPQVDLLSALDIARLADRFPDETSLGEQQRTAIARALVTGPDVLVLDEPTSHQDEEHTALIIERLVEAAGAGATLLVATHDERIVAAADQQLAIDDGTVAAVR